MIQNWVGGLDFVYLLYGLSFLLLGLSTLSMVRGLSDDRKAWRWFALFGVLNGLNGWAGMVSLAYPGVGLVMVVRNLLLAGSFVCLFEFGRRNALWSDGGRLRPWVYLPAGVLILSGTAYGMSGAMAMVRYGVAFPGALLSAMTFWQWSAAEGDRKVPVRRKVLVISMVAFAVISGLIPAPAAIGPAGMINEEWFRDITGVPIQLVRGLWACVVMTVFWREYVEWRGWQFTPAGMRRILVVEKIAVGIIVVLLAGTWLITAGIERKCLESRNSLMRSQGSLIALSINPERIKDLIGNVDNPPSEYAVKLSEQLQRVVDEFPDIRYLYLLHNSGQGIRFLMDIEPRKWWGIADVPNASPGDLYKDAPPEPSYVFKTGKALVSQPYRDKWGQFVSAYYPIIDASGQVTIVLGVDTDATFWKREVYFQRMAPLLITASVLLLFLVFMELWRRHIEEVERSTNTARLVQRQQAVLVKIANLISATGGDFNDLIRDILRQAGEVMQVDRVEAWQVDSGSRQFQPAGAYSVSLKKMEPGQPLDVRDCPDMGSILASQRVVEVRNGAVEGLVKGACSGIEAAGMRSLIMAPYREDGKVAGMIAFARIDRHQHWTSDDVRFAAEVADQISQMLINVRRHEASLTLRRMNEELEQRVQERTAELSRKNVELRHEMEERLRIEEEQRRLELQIQQKQKHESLGLMAGGIAHDFNNILMAIQGNVEMARLESAENSRLQDYLGDAEKAAARAVMLSQQMLAFSGRGHSVFDFVDMNQRVKDILEILKASISKKITIDCDLAETLPPVNGDPDQISQVIMNLVMNAAEAIGDKPGVIIIHTGDVQGDAALFERMWLGDAAKEGRYVFVEVTDTGIGMDGKVQARMFDPFFTTKFTGRGLGLATVAGIVRGHRGAIDVCSEVGKGTTMRVLFPARQTLDERKPAAAPPGVSKGRTILMVDDEEPVRILGKRMLSRLGYEVMTAADGVQALDLFRSHQAEIGCVLLDMTMPIMDGHEVFGKLRAIDPAVKVIVCSGYNEENIGSRFEDRDCVSFLQKPYSLNALAAALNRTLT